MRKSVVTAIVTTVFVIYSFYQRTIGVQATADVGPGAAVGPAAATPPQGPAGDQAATASSSPSAAQSNQRRGRAGGAPSTQPAPVAQAPSQNTTSSYRDGTFTGVAADAFYGNLQVQATISNGKLTNVQFPQWPNDRSRSVRINQQALPWLAQEAIQAQNAKVNVISGATDTSEAFSASLQSALSQAKS